LQVSSGCEIAPREHAPDEYAEPDLDLIEPGSVLWGVHEMNAMGRVAQEGCARFHRLQDAGPFLDAKINIETTLFVYQPHEGLGLVGVQLVDDEDPLAVRVRRDGAVDVGDEVRFGAGRAERRGDQLSGGHFAQPRTRWTWKLAINANVPWQMPSNERTGSLYSYSRRSTNPGNIGRV